MSSSPTPTPEPTATATPEPTATNTPEPTATATPEPTATATPEPTATATSTPTPTATATSTPTPTTASSPTPTATNTPTPTPTITPTATDTPTPTATDTPTPTITPTATDTPTPTATSTPTPSPAGPPTSTPCAPNQAQPVDITLVYDRSGSIEDRPLDDAKESGKHFAQTIDLLRNQIAVVSFASKAQLEIPLGHDLSALQAAIEAIENDHGSKISAGIIMAQQELLSERHNPAAAKVMIILSDGEADEKETRTLAAAKDATEHGIRIITIRLDSGDGKELMDQLALPGDSYTATTSADLHAIYDSIAKPFSRCGSSSPVAPPTATPAPVAMTLACEADTHINANSPDSRYGSADVMKASGSDPERWALVRCQAGSAPVRRAILRLYVIEEADGVHIFSTTNGWDERTTWNQRPQPGKRIASLGPTVEDSWVDIDVTQALQPDGSLSVIIQTDSKHDF